MQNVSADAAGHIKVETLTNIEPNNSYDWHIHPYWENRYVTEGRDNLANKGIASVSTNQRNQRGQILTSDIKERTVQILVSTQRLTT